MGMFTKIISLCSCVRTTSSHFSAGIIGDKQETKWELLHPWAVKVLTMRCSSSIHAIPFSLATCIGYQSQRLCALVVVGAHLDSGSEYLRMSARFTDNGWAEVACFHMFFVVAFRYHLILLVLLDKLNCVF